MLNIKHWSFKVAVMAAVITISIWLGGSLYDKSKDPKRNS